MLRRACHQQQIAVVRALHPVRRRAAGGGAGGKTRRVAPSESDAIAGSAPEFRLVVRVPTHAIGSHFGS